MREPVESTTFDFFGATFRFADEVPETALMDFAEAAQEVDSDGLQGLAVIKGLLRDCVHEDDWRAFWASARKNKAKTDEHLMPIVVAVFTGQTDRPTQQPSDSSDGLPSIAQNSTARSSGPVTHLYPVGRPDIGQIVEQAQASRAS